MQRQELQDLEQRIEAKGTVEQADIQKLRSVLNDDWKISRQEADFLVRFRNRVSFHSPDFQDLFSQSIRNFVVKDGRISAAETQWLRQWVYADRMADEKDKKFLRELRAEVTEVSPEFDAFYQEAMAEVPAGV
jgi:uncharacterized tellurite resistance protein B-like protein